MTDINNMNSNLRKSLAVNELGVGVKVGVMKKYNDIHKMWIENQ